MTKNQTALTPRQLRFCSEYIVDLCGTQAAIRSGYSARTANEQAARLLAKVSVQQAVTEAMQARSKRVELTTDEVIGILRREADATGPGTSHTARVRAAELLGKHRGMFPAEYHHLHGGNGNPIQVQSIGSLSDADRDARIRGYVQLIHRRQTALAEPSRAERIGNLAQGEVDNRMARPHTDLGATPDARLPEAIQGESRHNGDVSHDWNGSA